VVITAAHIRAIPRPTNDKSDKSKKYFIA